MTNTPESASPTVRISRTIPAEQEQVWRAWTDADALAAWFWPASFATACTVETRPGGAYCIVSEVQGIAIDGLVVSVEAPTRLEFVWRWRGDPVDRLVTVELGTVESGTEVVVLHEPFASTAERNQHAQGWSDCLDRLVAGSSSG